MGGEAGRRCGTNELWIENYHPQPDDEADDDDDDGGNGGGVVPANFQTLLRFKILTIILNADSPYRFPDISTRRRKQSSPTVNLLLLLSQKLIKLIKMSHEPLNSVVCCILRRPQFKFAR